MLSHLVFTVSCRLLAAVKALQTGMKHTNCEISTEGCVEVNVPYIIFLHTIALYFTTVKYVMRNPLAHVRCDVRVIKH